MPETKSVVNFKNMEDLRTEIYDTEVVPTDVWQATQRIFYESLKAALPEEKWDQAAAIARMDDFKTYRDRRVYPKHQAGKDGWNKEQIFRDPILAVTHDASNYIVSAVLTANNSSGHKHMPTPIWYAEALLKMNMPPGVHIPVIGNRRHVHVREIVVDPDAQEALEIEDDTSVVSGLAICSLYLSLGEYHTEQPLDLYKVPKDPADAALVNIAHLLDMQTMSEKPNPIPGYLSESSLVRDKSSVGRVMCTIIEIPGASTVIDSDSVSRIRKQTL